MKFRILLLCLFPLLALADIYKSVDSDGHVTYSSAPMRGAKRIVMTPSGSTTSDHPRASATPNDFPKVNKETQKGRDDTRRKILEDEFNTEQSLLNAARRDLQAAEANIPKDNVRISQLTKQVEIHQRNVAALNTELSRLK